MSRASDPEAISQFRRRWSERPAAIKFLSEMGEGELERLSLAFGEGVLRRLPAALTLSLTAQERRDLALAFGRPMLRRARQRRDAQRRRHRRA